MAQFRRKCSEAAWPESMLDRIALAKAIRKEQNRCDRYGFEFALVDIRLLAADGSSTSIRTSDVRHFAESLENQLRLSDEKAIVGKNRFQILLPHTNREEAKQVLQFVESMARKNQLQLLSKLSIYPPAKSKNHHLSLDPMDTSIDPNARPVRATPTESAELRHTSKIGNATLRDEPLSEWLASTEHFQTPYPLWKRSSDVLGASIGLVLSSPILLLSAFAIKIDSKGPVLFRQWRTGHCGRPFQILKLRTMRIGAEVEKSKLLDRNERDGPAFKITNDPRVTRVGKILRKLGIDELPQLWNVLRGDMGLVGPRPLPCREADQCTTWQRRRMDTKPGITCTWQVSKSRDVSFDKWMRMDLQYNLNRSIMTDLSLLWKTVIAVLSGRIEH